MERLILYGGAFDPIHNGHMRIAEEASSRLDADVIFLPTKSPRWKETSSKDIDRLSMLKIALDKANNPRFHLSEIEFEREGEETFTSDTIALFKEKYPKKELILLIGEDQVALFSKWHKADYIAKNAKICYVSRKGYEDINGNAKRYGMIPLIGFEAGEVSSSGVRELRFIDVPEEVLSYIEEHSLYYVEKLKSFLKEKRLRHSLSVARLSYRIALRNGLRNPGRAYIAGALHDIGKEIPEEEAYRMLPSLKECPRWAQHQFLGAYLAKKEFHIEDPEILRAIETHCTGDKEMNDLGKIVYASDKVDPLRGWDSSSFIALLEKDFEKGFLSVLEANREFIKNKHGNVESLSYSRECFEYYLGGKENGISKEG